MTKTAISPLRQRLIDDMTIRGFTAQTQRGYIRAVRDFAAFLGHSPDRAGVDIRHRITAAVTNQTGIGQWRKRDPDLR